MGVTCLVQLGAQSTLAPAVPCCTNTCLHLAYLWGPFALLSPFSVRLVFLPLPFRPEALETEAQPARRDQSRHVDSGRARSSLVRRCARLALTRAGARRPGAGGVRYWSAGRRAKIGIRLPVHRYIGAYGDIQGAVGCGTSLAGHQLGSGWFDRLRLDAVITAQRTTRMVQ